MSLLGDTGVWLGDLAHYRGTDGVPHRLAEHLVGIDQLGDWAAIIPCSAVRGDQVDEVADVLSSYLPTAPALYPPEQLSDEPTVVMIAELVREAALEGVRDELPHSLAVQVEEIVLREDRSENDPLSDVRVGAPDPVAAIDGEVEANPGYAGFIISTLPEEKSRWLRMDLPHTVRSKYGLPVHHVVAAQDYTLGDLP